MNEVATLINLLSKKAKLVAMLAPSFPIVYEYPQIISRLKKLGFEYVVEVAAGAKKTNESIVTLLQENPSSRFITSPCPSFVRLVRTKYLHLLPYLALKADSPMVATARIVIEKFPNYQPIFIGPCVVKKLESSQDYPQLNILVLTYKELDKIFKNFNITEEPLNTKDTFDIFEPSTRIYPLDGGLTRSSGVKNILNDKEIKIVSGWQNCQSALSEFEKNPKIRLLDVLFCESGCINGPGIFSKLNIEDRKKKILEYSQK